MKIAQSILLIFGVIAALGCLLVAGATAPAKPVPTTQPVITGVSAGEIKAIFDGLDTIQVDEVVLAAAEASRQDTEAAHTSELGQLVKDVSPALPWCVLGGFVAGCFLVSLVGMGLLYSERKRQVFAMLAERLGKIEQDLAEGG